MTSNAVRCLRLGTWIVCAGALLYAYFFRRDLIQGEMQSAVSASLVLGYGLYLLLGCVRGFTLLPSANLVILAIPFFRPEPLFLLTILAILVSSATIYLFAESLHLEETFNDKQKLKVERFKRLLSRNQMPIVIAWSFFPLAPTDIICYACGVLKTDFLKFVLGILIGQGAICGIYIFLGDATLRFFHLR